MKVEYVFLVNFEKTDYDAISINDDHFKSYLEREGFLEILAMVFGAALGILLILIQWFIFMEDLEFNTLYLLAIVL